MSYSCAVFERPARRSRGAAREADLVCRKLGLRPASAYSTSGRVGAGSCAMPRALRRRVLGRDTLAPRPSGRSARSVRPDSRDGPRSAISTTGTFATGVRRDRVGRRDGARRECRAGLALRPDGRQLRRGGRMHQPRITRSWGRSLTAGSSSTATCSRTASCQGLGTVMGAMHDRLGSPPRGEPAASTTR